MIFVSIHCQTKPIELNSSVKIIDIDKSGCKQIQRYFIMRLNVIVCAACPSALGIVKEGGGG